MSPETIERRTREKQMERYDRHMNKHGHFSQRARRPKPGEKSLQTTEQEGNLEQEEEKE